ncbi:uncharacterized protein LOC119549203 [Drosophila subpulchrella]|uniref:uncharacterized protein LOC119549203 n=1 Tax=Drosophila subpulchrella TaxID=1486046 RepID=UPI0018A18502|nr:uncharacterized protein LOC119549203 [Drosophila subpulchrella]
MRRSGLLLLISAFVLSAAVALPTSRKETQEVDYSGPSPLDLQLDLEELGIRRRAAEGDSSSSEELKTGAEEEATENVDSSAESSSSEEEQKTESAATESAARRRRSDEKHRNLYLLATICPNADTSHLEKGSSLDRRIEIRDMYAICDSLKQ